MTRHLYPRLPPSAFDRATVAFRDILLDDINDFAAQAKEAKARPGEGVATVMAIFLGISAGFSKQTHSRAQFLEACAKAWDTMQTAERRA
jgi:hypothetical protein